MRTGRRLGFTLIELLVVIVIIFLLAALLLPALIKAFCNAKAGAADHLIDQLSQAAKNYEFDFAQFPTGNGSGSAKLVMALTQPGPKKQAYFEFPNKMDDLDASGSAVNPVWAGKGDPLGLIHYRNNIGAGPGGGGGGGGPEPRNKRSFDMWCAGCNNQGEPPPHPTTYEISNWE